MARTGRPKTKIDKAEFEKLCEWQCSEVDICDWFDCCEDTLNSWCKRTYKDENGKGMTFSEVFARKRGRGRVSLRRKQWELAEKNVTMAIFLGKQYLDQSDNGSINETSLAKAEELLGGVDSVIDK